MALRKVARKKKSERLMEFYSIEGGYLNKIGVLGFSDVAEALAEKLKDYCAFDKHPKPMGNRGGRIADDVWTAEIFDRKGKDIALRVVQQYSQPGAVMYRSEVTLDYDPAVSKKDIGLVRKVIESVGLTRE